MTSHADDKDDPFSCFGESEDEEDAAPGNTDNDRRRAKISSVLVNRDEECGIKSFHAKTEASLLSHVSNVLRASPTSQAAAETVLSAIDEFCYTRHWMMHIGPEKGNDILIQKGLDRSLATYLSDDTRRDDEDFVAVEMGTYCGYSSILLGKRLQRAEKDHGIKVHLFTVEVDPEHSKIATQMIQLAGLQDIVSVVLITDSIASCDNNSENDELTMDKLHRSILPEGICQSIRFLFLDHEKTMYLPSLLSFQRCNLLHKRSMVVADNVIFLDIYDYIVHVKNLEKQGLVRTETFVSKVEYWTEKELTEHGEEALRDGVEITSFL